MDLLLLFWAYTLCVWSKVDDFERPLQQSLTMHSLNWADQTLTSMIMTKCSKVEAFVMIMDVRVWSDQWRECMVKDCCSGLSLSSKPSTLMTVRDHYSSP